MYNYFDDYSINHSRIFSEDLYLVDMSGSVLASREGCERGIKNFFDIFNEEDRRFLLGNNIYNAFFPLMIFDSDEGTVLIDKTTFSKLNVFVAIITDYPKQEVFDIVKNELGLNVLIATEKKAEML